MQNYIQRGDTITATAPSGGIASGDGMLFGALFGVASTTQDEGDEVEIAVVGVFTLPKVTLDTFAAGALVYWDDAAGKCTASQNTAASLPTIGVATVAAGSSATTLPVRLNGAAT